MKTLCLILTSAIACPALAQSDTTFMPEGSRDLTISAIAALVPRAEGSSQMRAIVLPSASVQWSNGVFLAPGSVGLRLSADGNLQYGPSLGYGVKNQRSDDPDRKTRLELQPGAFLSYALLHNLSLYGDVKYGGSNDNRGVQLGLGASFSTPVAQHRSVSLSIGAKLADKAYMQSYFGVDAQQSRAGHRPLYNAGSGLKNYYVSGASSVELSEKYAVTSGVSVSWLGHAAADSPLTNTRRGISIFTVLNYHY